MQYSPALTDQKLDSILFIESKTRYVLGRMQYAPTYTDQKFDFHLLDESETWQVFGCMSLRPTLPQQETIKICMETRETRRGLDGYGHFHAKPGGD